jgi:cardiolipin synthase
MEAMFLDDLARSTEIVPGIATRRRQRRNLRPPSGRMRALGRVAAGAIALGNTVGGAVAGARSLTATEARSIATIGVALLGLAVLVSLFPVLVISPIVITLVWFGVALLARAFRLHGRVRRRRRKERGAEVPAE